MVSDSQDRLLRAYTAFNSGEALDWSLFDPAIEHDQTHGLFLDGVFYGHDGLRAALGEIEADWEDLTLDPEQVIDLGDRILVLVRMRARVRDSHAELDAQVAHVWEFRDGRVVRWSVFGDHASAMRALSASGPFGAPVASAPTPVL
jgi:ketosteroid isomerase-like protein